MNLEGSKREIMRVCDCPFCKEYSLNAKSARVIWSNENLCLFPTIGCFVEGYCLLIPRRHLTSIAKLDFHEISDVSLYIKMFLPILSRAYRRTFIIAEHGSDEKNCGASCIEHAHIHLIPVINPLEVFKLYYNTGGEPIVIDDYKMIKNFDNEAYLYLSWDFNKHFIWKNTEKFQKQFVRGAVALTYGIEQFFNWRVYPFNDLMQKTVENIKPLINDEMRKSSKKVA